jgi:hypothetical protein
VSCAFQRRIPDRDKIVQELFNVVQIKKIEIAKAENQIGKLIVYLDTIKIHL